MKPSSALIAFLALSQQAISSPIAPDSDLIERDAQPESTWADALSLRDLVERDSSLEERSGLDTNTLEKRRGGGGSGGGGGRGSSGGSSSSGSGSSGGSRSGTGSTGSSGGTTGGGRTTSSSSGARPAYGGGSGGAVYGGGATTAYAPGRTSPGARLTPFLLGGVGLGLLAASWPHGAYLYGWNHPYVYHNNSNGQNETLPVKCLCDPDSACGCDEPSNSTYLDSLLPNGTSTNTSVATIQTVNGTRQVILNGTLPNGTDDSTVSRAIAGLPDARRVALDALVAAGVVVGALWI